MAQPGVRTLPPKKRKKKRVGERNRPANETQSDGGAARAGERNRLSLTPSELADELGAFPNESAPVHYDYSLQMSLVQTLLTLRYGWYVLPPVWQQVPTLERT